MEKNTRVMFKAAEGIITLIEIRISKRRQKNQAKKAIESGIMKSNKIKSESAKRRENAHIIFNLQEKEGYVLRE
ncbi:hypothetical protein CPB83DRAFT_860858 [Crepidotus variabilis]|uniref:Uncharacterized protein n=1 Tax=Crepidotus variabilis TaxID=179855 RepID=A0A9P6E900_9AGAR|nr:hypothetical protein CPB83DRAFT_860858 [Crepidotus variabilis]